VGVKTKKMMRPLEKKARSQVCGRENSGKCTRMGSGKTKQKSGPTLAVSNERLRTWKGAVRHFEQKKSGGVDHIKKTWLKYRIQKKTTYIFQNEDQITTREKKKKTTRWEKTRAPWWEDDEGKKGKVKGCHHNQNSTMMRGPEKEKEHPKPVKKKYHLVQKGAWEKKGGATNRTVSKSQGKISGKKTPLSAENRESHRRASSGERWGGIVTSPFIRTGLEKKKTRERPQRDGISSLTGVREGARRESLWWSRETSNLVDGKKKGKDVVTADVRGVGRSKSV